MIRRLHRVPVRASRIRRDARVRARALLVGRAATALCAVAAKHRACIGRRLRPGPHERRRRGDPIGVLEIPRLGLSSVVLEGDDVAALLFGVGHLSDTPLPWHGGNSVFAAHRDTFFRPLAHIRRNDVIRFSTADAEFEYVVKELKIVEPTDLEVLDPTSSATLTLITCYPVRLHRPGAESIHRQSGAAIAGRRPSLRPERTRVSALQRSLTPCRGRRRRRPCRRTSPETHRRCM